MAAAFRVLAVVDDGARECLALIADTSLSGARVVRELATLFEARGKPATVVGDNGTEFTSKAILTFADDRKIDWHTIARKADPRRAFIESFKGRLRDELLNEALFPLLHHARAPLAAWRTTTTPNARTPASAGKRLPTSPKPSPRNGGLTLRNPQGSVESS